MAFFSANCDPVFTWVESHLLFSATTLHQDPNVIALVENINQRFFKFGLHNVHGKITVRMPIQISLFVSEVFAIVFLTKTLQKSFMFCNAAKFSMAKAPYVFIIYTRIYIRFPQVLINYSSTVLIYFSKLVKMNP